MKTSTPFFAGFHQILFGRPRRSTQHILQQQAENLQRASLAQLAHLFAPWVPASTLACSPHERRRLFPKAVTFWAFLSQVMSPGMPCREILRKVQGWCAAHQLTLPDSNTGAYCKARKRLDSNLLRDVHRHTADRLEANVQTKQLWLGHRVKIIDGTGVSMPDTPKNQKAFPQPSGQKQGCGFPVAKLVGCFCLTSGALIDWAEGTLKEHESFLARGLWHLIRAGEILLTDRGFCSYELMATLRERKADTVMRLHQARSKDFRHGKRIGKNERRVLWHKPKKQPPGARTREWKKLPDTLNLRYVKIFVSTPGFRTQEIILVTTLLDPIRYPAEALGKLYLRRWAVELFFRDIKISLGMDILRCKTPDMVRKEIIMHAIAYNLIRALMQKAAALYEVDLARISFKGTSDTLRQWIEVLNTASRGKKFRDLVNTLMLLLAEDLVPERPHRVEPRAKKRRPKNYQLLTEPRHVMVVPSHRNRA